MASKRTFLTPNWRYTAVVALCFLAAYGAGWLPLAQRIDNLAYDWMSTQFKPVWEPQSVVVAVDPATFESRGGVPSERAIFAEALDKIAAAEPAAVAIDVILHDAVDPAKDALLEKSLRATRNLVLPCDLPPPGDKWEDPLRRFQLSSPDTFGHVELPQNPSDGVTRQIPLERIASGRRRWALSLRALAVARGQPITESPEDVQVGGTIIPAGRAADRGLFIRYLPAGSIREISVLKVDQNLANIRGKVVFLGITDLAAARDRLVNPYGDSVPGVVAHAQAFETMAHGEFLTTARDGTIFSVSLALAIAMGTIFVLLSGWLSYCLSAIVLGLAHYLPILFFHYNVVFPYFTPLAVTWLCFTGAATYRDLFVRGQLRRSESERSRYQQAIHWAAHEMRTPLTSIQGSSEIMTRYTLTDDKRHQLSEMINSESKRLSRIIQTFLDVERLADGQMELKREPFAAADVVTTCVIRAKPLAERKQIELLLDSISGDFLLGDRELMEYAVYNLLTNAVKYSPSGTQIHVWSESQGGMLRIAVRDQGMGMDARELKNIFKKFYRTRRAEASDEVGTGIGLSIVEQIVSHHGGRIDVTSEPGKGSCFMIVMKAHIPAPVPAASNAETLDRRG